MSEEHRSAFRISMPDGQKRATLRIKGHKYDVQLLDASATGVALACPLNCAVEIETFCELHTSCGGGQIRIVRKETFPDGILVGAERIGDLKDTSQGILGQAKELITLPTRALASGNLLTRFAALSVASVLLIAGLVALVNRQYPGVPPATAVQATLPTNTVPTNTVLTTPVAHQTPSPEEVRSALKSIEAVLPKLHAEPSASDQRAIRIFEQQRHLLEPDMSRRLRLTPTQESRIQRALAPAEELTDDSSNPEFWEAIRRSETQILTILTPAQVKAWRQQRGT
jgi:hypothetical protein